MNEIIAIPYEDLTPSQLRNTIGEVHAHIFNSDVASMLENRFLNGVVNRYEDIFIDPEAWETIEENTNQLANPDTPERGFRLVTSESNEFKGIGTLLPNLQLWKQRILGPTRLMRAGGAKSLGTSVPVDLKGYANVSAWIKPSTSDEIDVVQLAQAYDQLREQSPTGVWTINPLRPSTAFVHRALTAARFYQTVAPARFDDLEAEGTQMAPISRLYIADAVAA